ERPILPRPSARKVPRWRSLWPIWLRVWVIRSFAIRGLLRSGRVVALRPRGLAFFLDLRPRGLDFFLDLPPRRHRQNLAHRQPAGLGDLLGSPQALQAVHRRLEHVDWIRRPEALREDVADAAEFEYSPDAAAAEHTSPLFGRLHTSPASAKLPMFLVNIIGPFFRLGD